MSPTASGMDTVLASLMAVSERVSMQERTIGDRIDQIAEGQAELRGIVRANVERTEDVAKKLHDLRNDLSAQDVFKPERGRELQNRETRAIVGEEVAKEMAKFRAQMQADAEKRAQELRYGIGVVGAVGAGLAMAADWLAERADYIVAVLRMWKGNGH